MRPQHWDREGAVLQFDGLADVHPGWAVWTDLDLKGLRSQLQVVLEGWTMILDLAAEGTEPMEPHVVDIRPLRKVEDLLKLEQRWDETLAELKEQDPQERERKREARRQEVLKVRAELAARRKALPEWLVALQDDDYSLCVEHPHLQSGDEGVDEVAKGRLVEPGQVDDLLLWVRGELQKAADAIRAAEKAIPKAQPEIKARLEEQLGVLVAVKDFPSEAWEEALGDLSQTLVDSGPGGQEGGDRGSEPDTR